MRIVLVEIRNFRGIQRLDWKPSPGLNCLIGPGDSTKTTILDAIEMALSARSFVLANDSDFYDGDFSHPAQITVTFTGMPSDFLEQGRYGMHLRGWDEGRQELEDESREGLTDALSIRLTIDESLEPTWSFFNNRIGDDPSDPPTIRYRDSRKIVPTRLGPFAEKHLSWSRYSVLSRLGEKAETDTLSLQLAEAGRAARDSFREASKGGIFKSVATRAEELSRQFSVAVRTGYSAELDVQSVSITTGGVSLHDAKLPLRRLGTGSSRLLVSALQHEVGSGHVSLIDEIEHGLEPHRISRLLNHLKQPHQVSATTQQSFISTHSPVVIWELKASEVFRVRSQNGTTTVLGIQDALVDAITAQKHLRAAPEAFLARRIIVCEGRTEQGLLRGLDRLYWIPSGAESFALRGAVAVDGGGNTKATALAGHLLDLGYPVFVLLDSDKPVAREEIARIRAKGGDILEWPDQCCAEDRLFLDLPWAHVRRLVALAVEFSDENSVRDLLNNTLGGKGMDGVTELTLPPSLDTEQFRRALGRTAHEKNWFKGITRGERVAEELSACLDAISGRPLARGLFTIRSWIDG